MMSIIKNVPGELDPRLRQMLAAYRNAPERDPQTARRAEARFRAELEKLFPEPPIGPAARPCVPSTIRTVRD